MNNTYILLMLVNTLTKAEKRYFHLCANLQNGDKVYLTLFNLIDANTSPEQLYTRFCQIQDGKSFETAVKHLYRVLLECLVKLRENRMSKQEFSIIYQRLAYYSNEKYLMKLSLN